MQIFYLKNLLQNSIFVSFFIFRYFQKSFHFEGYLSCVQKPIQ
jgi:hypothetical protein